MDSKGCNRVRCAHSHTDNCSDLTYIETQRKGPIVGIVVLVLQTPSISSFQTDKLAPLNGVVKYKTIRQDGEDRSPYVSSERPIIDKMWMDLYDCKY